jgi:hypothetical protein
MYHEAENGTNMDTQMNSPGKFAGNSPGATTHPVDPVGEGLKDLSHLAGAQHRLSDAEVKDLVAESKQSFERFDELLAAEKA